MKRNKRVQYDEQPTGDQSQYQTRDAPLTVDRLPRGKTLPKPLTPFVGAVRFGVGGSYLNLRNCTRRATINSVVQLLYHDTQYSEYIYVHLDST